MTEDRTAQQHVHVALEGRGGAWSRGLAGRGFVILLIGLMMLGSSAHVDAAVASPASPDAGAGLTDTGPGLADADAGLAETDEEDDGPVVEDPASHGFDDPLLHLQWNLERTRTVEGWEITPGLSSVTVAVIDTGVDPNHRDLDGAFWTNAWGDNGYDYLRDTPNTFVSIDKDWHGTAVAGVVAARADDGYGMAGVAPGVSVMVRRIYASTSVDQPPSLVGYASAAQAIRDAAADGADVILLTWGGTVPNTQLADAIAEVGVPVVAAAGNDGWDLDTAGPKRYPAAYQLPNLITVAATDRDGQLLDNGRVSSNYGATTVDLAAPGEDIVAVSGDYHNYFEGTSFAAPQVAGALALGRSLAPAATSGELVSELLRTVRRSPALSGKVASRGELDVLAFLSALDRPVCGTDLPPSRFQDVRRDSVHVSNIDCVSYYRVARGVTSTQFLPERRITRGEMASFLARSLQAAGINLATLAAQGPELADDPAADDASGSNARAFPDIEGTTHADAIEAIAAAGIAQGRTDGTYGPNERVPRGQMATFLVRTVALLTGQDYEVDRPWFDDVDGHTHAESIRIARDLGITTGGSRAGTFEPDLYVSREQMASFMARTLDASGRQSATFQPIRD